MTIVFESCEDRWNRDEWFREEMLKEKNTVRTMQHWDTLITHLGSEEDQYLILKAERQRRFRDKVVIRSAARECDRHPSRDNWTSDWVSKSRTGGIAISESNNFRHQALDGGATLHGGTGAVCNDAFVFSNSFSAPLGYCKAESQRSGCEFIHPPTLCTCFQHTHSVKTKSCLVRQHADTFNSVAMLDQAIAFNLSSSACAFVQSLALITRPDCRCNTTLSSSTLLPKEK